MNYFLMSTFTLLFISGCSIIPPKKNSSAAEHVIDSPSNSKVHNKNSGSDFDAILLLHKKKQWKNANLDWKKYLIKHPKSFFAHLNLGISYRHLNNPQKASEAFYKAIEISPNNHHVWRNLGLTQRELGLFNESEQSYQKALSIEPDDYLSHINIGVLYDLYKNNLNNALHHYQLATKLHPEAKPLVDPWIKEISIRLKNNE